MSRIYLDTNVYSNLRTKATPLYAALADALSLYKSNLSFFFSPTHITDKKRDLTNKKFEDFDFIETFTRDNHISYHALKKNPSFYLATPKMVYDDQAENITTMSDMLEAIKSNLTAHNLFAAIFSRPFLLDTDLSILTAEQKAMISQIIPLDKPDATLADVMEKLVELYGKLMTEGQTYKDLRKLVDQGINNGKYTLQGTNNLDFNEMLRESPIQKSFIDFVRDTTQSDREGNKEYYDFYLLAYLMMDMLGIQKDKLSEKNSFSNITNDSQHSYYGRYFDYFVTADEDLRTKSKGLYSLFESETEVLSVEEFHALLPSIGKTTDDSIFMFFEKLSKDIREVPRTNPIVDEDGREQGGLLTENRYFNFFDCVFEIKEKGFTHYFLRKLNWHLLSRANYREQEAVITRCLHVFGLDGEGKGPFDFERELEEIENNSWRGRFWRIGPLAVIVGIHPGFKEFCVQISPVDGLLKKADTPEQKDGEAKPNL